MSHLKTFSISPQRRRRVTAVFATAFLLAATNHAPAHAANETVPNPLNEPVSGTIVRIADEPLKLTLSWPYRWQLHNYRSAYPNHLQLKLKLPDLAPQPHGGNTSTRTNKKKSKRLDRETAHKMLLEEKQNTIRIRIGWNPGLPSYDHLDKDKYLPGNGMTFGLSYDVKPCGNGYKFDPTIPLDENRKRCRPRRLEKYLAPPLDEGRSLKIHCNNGCYVFTSYKGFSLTYDLHPANLAKWKTIDQRVRKMLDQHTSVEPTAGFADALPLAIENLPEVSVNRTSKITTVELTAERKKESYRFSRFSIPDDYLSKEFRIISRKGKAPWLAINILLSDMRPEKPETKKVRSMPKGKERDAAAAAIAADRIRIKILAGTGPNYNRFTRRPPLEGVVLSKDFFGLELINSPQCYHRKVDHDTPLNFVWEHCRLGHSDRLLSPPLEGGRAIIYSCASACTARTEFRDVRVEYSLSRAYLAQWRQVDRRIQRFLELLFTD